MYVQCCAVWSCQLYVHHLQTTVCDRILLGFSILAYMSNTYERIAHTSNVNPLTLCGWFWFQFICQFCYKPYGSKQNMVFHLRAVHGVGGDPPRCKTCGRADFKSQAALCQHSKKCQKAGK